MSARLLHTTTFWSQPLRSVASDVPDLRLLRRERRRGCPVGLVYAEDDGVSALLYAARVPSVTGPINYERTRPRSGPIVAVTRVIELVRRHGTAAHVLHVSTAEEVNLLVAAAAAGLPMTFEVTPHHLSFTSDDVDRIGPASRWSRSGAARSCGTPRPPPSARPTVCT